MKLVIQIFVSFIVLNFRAPTDNLTVSKLTAINVPFDVYMFCKYFYLHSSKVEKQSMWGKHSVIHKRRSLVVDT